VIVYNRTAKPITIHLYVLGTNYVNGNYQFGKPTTGLAADTSLGTDSVKLRPYQELRVPVTIHMPRGVKTTTLAGIGAEAAGIDNGDLTVMEQLVVLVKATPSDHLIPPAITKGLFPWALIAIALIAVTGGLIERERRKSRVAGQSAGRRRPPIPVMGRS
jgi:hypothetical protein